MTSNGDTLAVLGVPSGPVSALRSANLGGRKAELKHPACKNWLIHLHYIRREFETCKSIIFEELQRTNGKSEYANHILALIYRSEGKMQESLDKLQICHELEPANANIVKQVARSLFLLGRHKLAIEAYQQARLMNEQDSDSETYYNMGMCCIFMKNMEKAKDYMNLSLQARVSQEAFEALAQISLANRNLPDAIIVYEKAARVFPENPDILSTLGLLYMKVGRDDMSFSRLGAALAFEPHNSKALVAMASMMQTHEDYEQALGKYKIAMETIPDSASIWNNIGMCFYFLPKKKFVAAISCLKRAYYLSPFDWKILHNLGLIHLHMQQYASAFHFLTASINLKPDQSHNFMLLGVAISHLEDIEYAKHAYEQALRLNAETVNTDPATLWLNYGISLFNHKQYDEAYQKLMQVHTILSKAPKASIDPEVKATYSKVRAAITLLGYNLPKESEQDIQPVPVKELPGTSTHPDPSIRPARTKLKAPKRNVQQEIDFTNEPDLV